MSETGPSPAEASNIGQAHSAVYREVEHINERLALLSPEDRSQRVTVMRTSLQNVGLNADAMDEAEVVRQYAKQATEKARLE